MKYIVYLTTNSKSQVNGINRIYIGVHKTENPNIFDGYIGCGVYVNCPSTYKYPKTAFQCAVKKYGTSAFSREILYTYDNYKDAYAKEAELVNKDFISQDHVYNMTVGGEYGGVGSSKPLYQFDLNGNLIKYWELGVEAYEFYGVSRKQISYAIWNKHPFMNSLWSYSDKIDVTEYQTQKWGEPKMTYLYSKEGKLLDEFESRKECGEYLGLDEATIVGAIKRNSLLLKKYYVSNSIVDLYIPKARKQYINTTFYIYEDYKYIGEYVGKAIMPIVGENSWSRIRDYLRSQRGWYKNFYISEIKIDESKIPTKQFGNGIQIDVYDKYGNFIETLPTIKEVKEKYKINASKIKNIQLGDRYVGDYIFKYHSRNNK